MKLLVVLPRVPFPLEKGDKLRAYHQIRCLSRNHEIYLFALTDKSDNAMAEKELKPFCKKICFAKIHVLSRIWNTLCFFFKGLPLQCGWFYDRMAKRTLQHFIKETNPDHIYCQLVRTAEYVKTLPIPKTIDYQDVLSKGMLRRYETSSFLLKPVFLWEGKRLAKYEEKIFPYFDHKTIITGVDRELIPHPQNEQIHVIANGVDFSHYQYSAQEKEYDLMFAGNMSYAPNIDAAEYIAQELFPALRERFPQLKLVLCGASPSIRVQKLRQPGITVTGWVDSMAEYYAKSKIFIAPMHIGTGLQNKLLEAMAMKLPCVTSPLAGKPLTDIADGKEIIICHTATGYIDAITFLLENHDKYAEIAENGFQFVKMNYNWDAMGEKLSALLEGEAN